MSRPNLLFFHVDNISTGDFGCYGGGITIGAQTPNVDRFAAEGLKLTSYNVEAQCTPTRSALMTGRHSVRTGCTSVMPGNGLVAWEVTIAQLLQDAGYRNAILGKWHCGKEEGRYATDHGFDYWYGIGDTWDVAMWPDDKFFQRTDFEPEYVLESTGPGHLEQIKVIDRDVRRDIDVEFMDKAEAWMSDAVEADEPFFVYFNHSNMHFPTLPGRSSTAPPTAAPWPTASRWSMPTSSACSTTSTTSVSATTPSWCSPATTAATPPSTPPTTRAPPAPGAAATSRPTRATTAPSASPSGPDTSAPEHPTRCSTSSTGIPH
nr:sulfatase-like hydrolase/transferase [Nocardioides sambongensis]